MTDGTVGLYLGWIVVATAANVAAVLAQAGLRDTVNAPDAWAVAVLAVAGLVGVALAVWDRGRFAPSAAICWGLAWVGTARLTGRPRLGAGRDRRDRRGGCGAAGHHHRPRARPQSTYVNSAHRCR